MPPIVAHALVMIYQMISLNVAVNSYDNALLSLLVSNQFVEIKGSVFKKFEKDSLFQITCAGTAPNPLAPSPLAHPVHRYRGAFHPCSDATSSCLSQLDRALRLYIQLQ